MKIIILVTVRPAILSHFEIKILIVCMISVCFLLLLFFESPSVFDAMGQQGGSATGGSATSGSAIGGGGTPCYGNTCYYYNYGGAATGGAATGGAANGPKTQDELSQTPSTTSPYPVDGIPCDALEHTLYHLHTHLDIFWNGIHQTIPKDVGIIPEKCLHWMHTHDDSGIIHMESPINMTYILGNFLDIWTNQTINSLGIPSKVYVNGVEDNNINYRLIPLKSLDEIALIYGNYPDNIPSKYDWGEDYGS